jgi:hypothetical protein
MLLSNAVPAVCVCSYKKKNMKQDARKGEIDSSSSSNSHTTRSSTFRDNHNTDEPEVGNQEIRADSRDVYRYTREA